MAAFCPLGSSIYNDILIGNPHVRRKSFPRYPLASIRSKVVYAILWIDISLTRVSYHTTGPNHKANVTQVCSFLVVYQSY